MAAALHSIPAHAFLPDRPFTNPAHTEADRLTLRYLIARLRETRDRPDYYAHLPPPATLFYPEPDQRHHRQVLAQPLSLFGDATLPVVGFFGQRLAGADRSPLDGVDGQLLNELSERSGLAAYCTVALAGGDFGNLVVFASLKAKERWRDNATHAYAAQELAPGYFASVRIYNGQLRRGLEDVDALHLSLVKYFDFSSHPAWRGLRRLA